MVARGHGRAGRGMGFRRRLGHRAHARMAESRYHGIDGIRRFLSEWLEVWGDYEIEIDQVLLAPDGRVVSLIRHHGKGRQSGVPLDLEMAQIATLRDGRFVRFDNYDNRADALKAAGIE